LLDRLSLSRWHVTVNHHFSCEKNASLKRKRSAKFAGQRKILLGAKFLQCEFISFGRNALRNLCGGGTDFSLSTPEK
jgi:hypothetical protein